MTLSILLIINAALALFRGIGFIFVPAKLWATFKVTLDNTPPLAQASLVPEQSGRGASWQLSIADTPQFQLPACGL